MILGSGVCVISQSVDLTPPKRVEVGKHGNCDWYLACLCKHMVFCIGKLPSSM